MKTSVTHALQKVQERINAYLDGDLETARRFPHVLQDLDDELQEEEDSEWSNRTLSHHGTVKGEENWRNCLSDIDYPKPIQAEKKFFGGKQVQRAFVVFELGMIGKLKDSNILIHILAYRTHQMFFSRITSGSMGSKRIRGDRSWIFARRAAKRKLGKSNHVNHKSSYERILPSIDQPLDQTCRDNLQEVVYDRHG